MGYRHQLMSSIISFKRNDLPQWFLIKYDKIIDFDRDFWVSFYEHKRYGALLDFNNDVFKIVKELEIDRIELVYFADEGLIEDDNPDISHVLITQEGIIEVKGGNWIEQPND